jgi:hypothetical protein
LNLIDVIAKRVKTHSHIQLGLFAHGKTRKERKNPQHERRGKNKTMTMITMNMMTWQGVLGGLGLTLCTIEHIERKQDHEWELTELV